MYTMIKEGTSINMKLFAFSLREYDEKQYMDAICEKLGIEYRYTPDYPSDENLHLCEECDCVSIITSITDKPLLDKLYALGVRYIATRSIGYEHIDVAYAHQLGMKVSNVGYAPESVYVISIVVEVGIIAVRVWLSGRAYRLPVRRYCVEVLGNALLVSAIAGVFAWWIELPLSQAWASFVAEVLMVFLFTSIVVCALGITRNERMFLFSTARKQLHF